MASLTVENYVKTIHQIAAREAGTDGLSVVSTGQIAKEMGVTTRRVSNIYQMAKGVKIPGLPVRPDYLN